MKNKILVLMGTRPEAIKLAPVIIELNKNHKSFSTKVCVSGQHGQMLYQVLKDFNISPDFDLQVMQSNQTLAELSSRIFIAFDEILNTEKPDWVLVQGDTTTAMIGSFCSYYRMIKVGHVEAGLRSHDFWIPFPEEMNRKAISLVAEKHYAPTHKAQQNLLAENVPSEKIYITGNTVIDALLYMVKIVRKFPPQIDSSIEKLINEKREYVLITGHRRESFGEGFKEICSAIRDLALLHTDTHFVYPVHLNPNVQKPVNDILKDVPNIILTTPLDYKSFIWTMDNCTTVLSDSGGVQEEAPTLGKPVLVMREVTERTEGIEAGSSILVGTNRNKITDNVTKVLEQIKTGTYIMPTKNPYGDGKSAKRIVSDLKDMCVIQAKTIN